MTDVRLATRFRLDSLGAMEAYPATPSESEIPLDEQVGLEVLGFIKAVSDARACAVSPLISHSPTAARAPRSRSCRRA